LPVHTRRIFVVAQDCALLHDMTQKAIGVQLSAKPDLLLLFADG
jgi:hypothetical protein